ncbi:unnamed protein product [Moneuplotes crassus]|uniref:Uncharacterized protein n=1 Tax=Euplotes crassus TaxID=5936 RepID=A0AAD1X3C3_EUPCR|nr:unnamed protein product [Moneuplotes crassus]
MAHYLSSIRNQVNTSLSEESYDFSRQEKEEKDEHKMAKLSCKIKEILNRSKQRGSNKNAEALKTHSITEKIFKQTHNRTMEEINLLRKYLNRKKTPVRLQKIHRKGRSTGDGRFEETSIQINRVVNKELREKELKEKKQYQQNFGEFEMPKVEPPKFIHRSSSQIQAELAKVPFRSRITNYCGENQAYFRYKRNTLLQKEDSPDIQKKLPEINQKVLDVLAKNAEISKIISMQSSKQKKAKKTKREVNKSNIDLNGDLFKKPKRSVDYSTIKSRKVVQMLDSGEIQNMTSIRTRKGSMYKTPMNMNTKRLGEKSDNDHKRPKRSTNRSVIGHQSKLKLPDELFQSNNDHDILKNQTSRSKKILVQPITTLTREGSKESLINKDKLDTIITECDQYRKKDKVSPLKKLEYAQFLENYYQENFNNTIDLMKKFKGSDPHILERFYNYETIKREEEMVRVAEVAKQYKRNITNPCRTIAVLERIGSTHKGKPH